MGEIHHKKIKKNPKKLTTKKLVFENMKEITKKFKKTV